MGQGEDVKTRPDPEVEIQERGEIFFFYRPKVEREEAHSPEDVQRLYIVLRAESGERPVEEKQDPHSGKEGSKKINNDDIGSSTQGGHGSQEVNIEKQPLLRFIVMGKKSLPDPAKKSLPYWGYVELVTTDIEDIKNALKGEEYDTATRGHRHKPAARALGEGVYRILRHNPKKRMHTHLVYKLELPPENKAKMEPQESQHRTTRLIKNPEQPGSPRFRGLQNKRRAAFPAHLQGQFGHRRFAAADPPDFLNYEGCEFLLIAASDDIEEELGLDLKAEECDQEEKSCSDLVRTFGEIGSAKPLFEGTWA
ncbi:hypothetical protein L484_013842 [Morus notabilis]|uniref:Uncharacterized protein n=1 Tax=Morus notabilis TaxID=981085 RepID=W9SAU2_9ROSA|nr:hypothetical protein L484_013842 [Morus notabilis]